jgi:hypothetical protein
LIGITGSPRSGATFVSGWGLISGVAVELSDASDACSIFGSGA